MSITRYLVIATLGLSSTAYAAEDAKLDQILEIVLDIKAEQDVLRVDVDRLKSSQEPQTVSNDAAPPAEPASEPEKPKKESSAIKRERGRIASIYTSLDYYIYQQGTFLGAITLEGFPVNQAEYLNEFKVNDVSGYEGDGEIKIEEDGFHTFNLYTTLSSRRACSAKMKIGGKEILNFEYGNYSSGTYVSGGKVDLTKGYYDFEFDHFCTRGSPDVVEFDLKVITPDAMSPESVGKRFIYHRTK